MNRLSCRITSVLLLVPGLALAGAFPDEFVLLGPEDPPGQGQSLRRAPWHRAADVAIQIAQRIDGAAQKGDFSGVVAVAREGRPWFVRASGLADRERSIPNLATTRFNTAGLQRLFTMVAIARLLQDGRLRLDDRLVDVLRPESSLTLDVGDVEPAAEKLSAAYPNAEVARRITIRQLVEQRSGLSDYLGPGFFANPRAVTTLADYLRLFTDRPLAFEPGSAERLAMANYIVLGRVIEAKTGKPYDRAIEELVHRPAGMTSTRLEPVAARAPDRAVGYTRTRFTLEGATVNPARAPGDVLRPNEDVVPGRGSPAGGGYSNVQDLMRFADALRHDRLLQPGWTEWILGGPEPRSASQAKLPLEHRRGLAMDGSAPGVNAVFRMEPDGTVLIALANLDPPAADRMALEVAELLLK